MQAAPSASFVTQAASRDVDDEPAVGDGREPRLQLLEARFFDHPAVKIRDVDGTRAVVLVEGVSDQAAVEALARRRGHELDREGVAVVPIGGAQSIGRFLQQFGPRASTSASRVSATPQRRASFGARSSGRASAPISKRSGSTSAVPTSRRS